MLILYDLFIAKFKNLLNDYIVNEFTKSLFLFLFSSFFILELFNVLEFLFTQSILYYSKYDRLFDLNVLSSFLLNLNGYVMSIPFWNDFFVFHANGLFQILSRITVANSYILLLVLGIYALEDRPTFTGYIIMDAFKGKDVKQLMFIASIILPTFVLLYISSICWLLFNFIYLIILCYEISRDSRFNSSASISEISMVVAYLILLYFGNILLQLTNYSYDFLMILYLSALSGCIYSMIYFCKQDD